MQLDLIKARDTSTEVGQVTCPNCQVVMRRIATKRVEGENGLCEVSYRCPRCDAETKRWMGP